MRLALTLCLLATPLLAQEARPQIEWSKSWAEAFEQAARDDKPVMVCINSKDGESANERAAKSTYRDAEFVAATNEFVMVIISLHKHIGPGKCRRFGGVPCTTHIDCYKALRAQHIEKFSKAGSGGEMISPQHAFFRPDGTLLRRKEYELTKAELLKMMREVRQDLAAEAGMPPPDVDGPIGADAPLTPREEAEVERVKTADRAARRAALGNLLSTEKIAAHEALLAVADGAKDEVLCDIMRAFGLAQVVKAREFIESHATDKNAVVRSFAYVALEELKLPESIELLMKRAKKDRNTTARKNAYRALGECAAATPHKKAAKALLGGLKDKQKSVAKHAALSMRHHRGESGKLVLTKLEKALGREKTPEIRGGLIYTLAHIGNRETTLPMMEKILEGLNIDYQKRFVRTAIKKLESKGGDFGRSAWFLFSEDREDPARKE
ncbi:MAG: HEAT repeat domain-containing protein [Planctomycetota bacterium]